MKLTQEQLRHIIKEEFDAVVAEKASKKARRKKRAKAKKKKTKKAGGGDRCTRIAKRKYDVWPSAYASGAVVKCRQGKIWKGLKEMLSEDDFKPHMMYNPKTGDKKKAEKHADHEALAKKGYTHVNPKELEKILDKEGGAAGLKPMVQGTESSEEEVIDTLDGMGNVGKHKKGDYIKDDGKQIKVQKEGKKNCGCGQDPCITYGKINEEAMTEYDDVIVEEDLDESSRCTKVTKKASSTRKGKKWMKCVKSDSGGYKRIHWGQAGVRVTGKSGHTTRKKSFKKRHGCSKAKSNTPKGQACKDWAE